MVSYKSHTTFTLLHSKQLHIRNDIPLITISFELISSPPPLAHSLPNHCVMATSPWAAVAWWCLQAPPRTANPVFLPQVCLWWHKPRYQFCLQGSRSVNKKWAEVNSSSTHGFMFSLFSEHGHWNLKQDMRAVWAVWCWHGDCAAEMYEMLEHWEDSEDSYLSSISHVFHFICILWALTVQERIKSGFCPSCEAYCLCHMTC